MKDESESDYKRDRSTRDHRHQSLDVSQDNDRLVIISSVVGEMQLFVPRESDFSR